MGLGLGSLVDGGGALLPGGVPLSRVSRARPAGGDVHADGDVRVELSRSCGKMMLATATTKRSRPTPMSVVDIVFGELAGSRAAADGRDARSRW